MYRQFVAVAITALISIFSIGPILNPATLGVAASLVEKNTEEQQSYGIQPSRLLSSQSIMLNERVRGGGFMSDVMADNILLTLSYLNDEPINRFQVDWAQVRRDRVVEFTLNPGQSFAFHEDILPEYDSKVVKTTNSHFNLSEGFKHDGYLPGDGVCHFASLMYWVAKEANLTALAPRNHNFMEIPGIAREHGVAIYFMPGSKTANSNQNLYITNSFDSPVTFWFTVSGNELQAQVIQSQ